MEYCWRQHVRQLVAVAVAVEALVEVEIVDAEVDSLRRRIRSTVVDPGS